MALAAFLGSAAWWHFNYQLNGFEFLIKQRAPVQTSHRPSATGCCAGTALRRPSSFTQFEQTGEMWSAPGATPVAFTARQTISSTATAFLWRAAAGPAVAVKVIDYAMDSTGGLEARILGVIPVARDVGSPQMI